jgi:hypothetical protein
VPALKQLGLDSNTIGSEGVRHLCDALVRGAFPALEHIDLSRNTIDDQGASFLQDALERGAAPKLKNIYLRHNDVSPDAERAVWRQRVRSWGQRELPPTRVKTDEPVDDDYGLHDYGLWAWDNVPAEESTDGRYDRLDPW